MYIKELIIIIFVLFVKSDEELFKFEKPDELKICYCSVWSYILKRWNTNYYYLYRSFDNLEDNFLTTITFMAITSCIYLTSGDRNWHFKAITLLYLILPHDIKKI